jgi:putative ABC transport system permease protein
MRRAIRLLNLRRLARIRLRMLIAIVAVAAGSSLALSVVVVNASASYSLNRLNQQVAGGAELRVVGATSAGGIDFQTLAAAAATPGVQRVIPMVEAVTVVRTANGHHQSVLLLGINCGAGGLVSEAGCVATSGSSSRASSSSATTTPTATSTATSTATPSNGSGAIFITRSLSRQLNSNSWLETNEGVDSLAHAAVISSLDSVNRGDVVVMPLSQAQQQFNRGGRIDDIYVIPDKGVSTSSLRPRLERAVGAWNGVVDASSVPPSVSLVISSFTPILGLLALLSSAIAVVLVYNVIALTLEERRRERAIVAAVGAPPTVLILGPLLEAAVLGAVGGLLGALGGIVVARPIVGTLSHLTVSLAGVPVSVHTTSSTYITGIIIGAVIGMLAAARPIQKAMRSDIAAEISGREQRERTSNRATLRRAVIFTVFSIGGVFISWLGARNGSLQQWQPDAALLGFVIGAIFSILASGIWTTVAVRLILLTGRFRKGVTQLGLANLLRDPGRTAVMSIAIGAAVIVAFITSSYNRAIDQDIATGLAQSNQAHSVLVSTYAGANGNNIDGQLPPNVTNALARLPGVSRIDDFDAELAGHSVGQLILVESETYPSFNVSVFAGTATARRFNEGQVLIGANLSRRDHVHPGSYLHIDTPTGIARVKVQGVWNDGNAGGDNVYLPMSLRYRLFGPQLPSEAALELKPGVSASHVAALARRDHLGSYLKYQTPSSQLKTADNGISGQLAPFLVLQRALLLVAFISVLATLLLAGIQRRREFGLLGAVGMTPRELFRMVVSEALAVSITGSIVGVPLGLLMLYSMLNVTPLLAGYHDTYSPDFLSLAFYIPLAVVVSVLAALWPGREAARTPILEALKYE